MKFLLRCKLCKTEAWFKGNTMGGTGVELLDECYPGEYCSHSLEDGEIIGDDYEDADEH
jgi:hypothetical protein